MMPSLSVVQTCAVRRRNDDAGALFARESQRARQQSLDEPLEADRNLVQPPSELVRRRSRSCCC